jgi:hypothetical protein
MNGTWKHHRALTGVAVALLSATGFAAVGDLEYAKSPPPGPGMYVRFGQPTKLEQAGKLKQLGAVEAVVAEGKATGIRIAAAVIRTKADTEDFDTIRLDVTGKGDFADAPKFALKTVRRTDTRCCADIVPGPATLKKDGRDIPVTVGGHYHVVRGKPSMWLRLSAAVEGTCAFGETTRKVRILDTTGDLEFGGRGGSAAYLRGGLETTSLVPSPVGDKVQVADSKGRFDDLSISAGTMLGQPVQVARAWFLVRVSGMKVSAEPLEAPMGKIAGSGENWQLHLTGRKFRIIVNGGAKAVPLPVDTYRVARCVYFRPADRGKAVPAVSTYPRVDLKIGERETTSFKMGLPIKATLSAQVSSGQVRFSVIRVDAAGYRILRVMNAAGERPEAPAIDVVDKTGKVVYTAKLEYG